LLWKIHVFHEIFFVGRFSAAFGKKRRPYGRQFFSPNYFFLGPVLSYFAEFSAGWQQWPDTFGEVLDEISKVRQTVLIDLMPAKCGLIKNSDLNLLSSLSFFELPKYERLS
jgi:hypothetical protein